MRYLAIDSGKKRTGLAVGDDAIRIASPVGIIEASGMEQRVRKIGEAIKSHSPDALVLGLPINMDGSEGAAAQHARSLAELLSKQFQMPVHLVDERLSTHVAEDQLREMGVSQKAMRGRRDALAAATILRDFFETL